MEIIEINSEKQTGMVVDRDLTLLVAGKEYSIRENNGALEITTNDGNISFSPACANVGKIVTK